MVWYVPHYGAIRSAVEGDTVKVRDNGAPMTGSWVLSERPTKPGGSYLVLGFDTSGEGVVYWIADPDGGELLLPVPADIVEIEDGRVSAFWRASSRDDGLTVGPAAMANPYFAQFVAESRGSAQDDFRRIVDLLSAEENERDSSTGDLLRPVAE